jgi:hypothetical protein
MKSRISSFALALCAGWALSMISVVGAHAQTALCPPGFALQNGACTNGASGAFSGAALSTQALSELSQTTTQESSRNALNSIANRREQEAQRCAPGFSRVDGRCKSDAPRPIVTAPEPAPRRAAVVKPKHEKARVARAHSVVEPVEPVRRPRLEPAAPLVRKGPLPSLVVEEPLRLAVWGQVFGDYEKRYGAGLSSILCCQASGGQAVPLGLSVSSETGTVGGQMGFDVTTRNLFLPDDGLIAGAILGYVSSDLSMRTTSVSSNTAIIGHGFGFLNASISGPTTGVYATYFSGPFSADLLVKFDLLSLQETSSEALAFSGGPPPGPGGPGQVVPFFQSASTSLTNSTVASNINYRFSLTPNLWIEPTVGAQYTNSSYGGGAANAGLADGYLVMVQGGARLGVVQELTPGVTLTTTLTGLAYDDVAVRGGFVAGATSQTTTLLAQADEGQVRGRGVLAFHLDLGNGVSTFVQGEARGGSGLFGAGGKGGIRFQW